MEEEIQEIIDKKSLNLRETKEKNQEFVGVLSLLLLEMFDRRA